VFGTPPSHLSPTSPNPFFLFIRPPRRSDRRRADSIVFQRRHRPASIPRPQWRRPLRSLSIGVCPRRGRRSRVPSVSLPRRFFRDKQPVAVDVAMLDLSSSHVPRKVSSAGSGSASPDQRRGSAPNHRRSPMHGRILNRSSSAFALARYSSHDSLNNNSSSNMSLAARVAAFVNMELEQQQQQQQQQHSSSNSNKQQQQQQPGNDHNNHNSNNKGVSVASNSLNVSPMNGVGIQWRAGVSVATRRADRVRLPRSRAVAARRSASMWPARTRTTRSLARALTSDLDDDDFDDFGSESSFSSVGSVGLSALTIDHESPRLTNSPRAVRRPTVRRRPSETALRPSVAAVGGAENAAACGGGDRARRRRRWRSGAR
jgi:hypothetical protein